MVRVLELSDDHHGELVAALLLPLISLFAHFALPSWILVDVAARMAVVQTMWILLYGRPRKLVTSFRSWRFAVLAGVVAMQVLAALTSRHLTFSLATIAFFYALNTALFEKRTLPAVFLMCVRYFVLQWRSEAFKRRRRWLYWHACPVSKMRWNSFLNTRELAYEPQISFLTAMMCLNRTGISLPKDIRRMLWQEVHRNECFAPGVGLRTVRKIEVDLLICSDAFKVHHAFCKKAVILSEVSESAQFTSHERVLLKTDRPFVYRVLCVGVASNSSDTVWNFQGVRVRTESRMPLLDPFNPLWVPIGKQQYQFLD